MENVIDPQIVDAYNDEPTGARIINGLNAEFEAMYQELELVKAERDTYQSFYRENSHLRMPLMNDGNRALFEEFIRTIVQDIEDAGDDVLPTLCESVYSRGVYEVNERTKLIILKLHGFTGEKNKEACEHCVLTKLSKLAAENMGDWLCGSDEVVDSLLFNL